MLSLILPLICGFSILIIDQISKLYIINNFVLYETKEFLNGFIDLVYIHNTGSAWGMFGGKTVFLIALTSVALLLCAFFVIKLKKSNLLMTWALSLLLFGGLGNLIDRIFRDGNVVDFLHFEFWPNFPVFNIADCAVVVGAGLLMLSYILDIIKEYKQNKNGKD